MELQLQVNGAREAIEKLKEIPGAAQKAVSLAINSALRKGRTVGSDAVAERYNIKRGQVYSKFQPYFSNSRNLVGFLNVRGAAFPLQNFLTSYTREGGAEVEVLRGKKVRFEHLFTAQMKSGHVGLFGRRDPKTGAVSKRYPIHEPFSISLPQMLGERKEVLPLIEESMQENLDYELNRQINRFLAEGFSSRE
jgi:hypothetical protein